MGRQVPEFSRIPQSQLILSGTVSDYLEGMIDQWLLVAPLANPAMLGMFRDRDNPPQRQMVPWAGEFAGKYITSIKISTFCVFFNIKLNYSKSV